MTPHDSTSQIGAVDLTANARRVGSLAWIATQLFETTGAWVGSTAEPEVKLWLGQQTYHFAWHAEIWRERLPELREFDRDDFVLPSPAASAAVEALRAFDGTVERLAGLGRAFIPRLVSSCDVVAEATREVADMPLRRTLRLVRRDLVDDWRSGEALLQSLVTTRSHAERAASAVAEVEGAIAGAHGTLVDV